MENKKMIFEIDAGSIDIKPLLKQEFLELHMKAISSANPNRNNSWFTVEAMQKALPSFKNKPILGYFENGDFVSHNGEWEKDTETGLDYWNTYGQKGERILGLIRGDDDIQIVEDKDGLSWICLSCALWVQYNFKQVKRLLKDAKKAKMNGQSAKNISVEIDVIDYEVLDNGVTKINDFNLVGITILGSRNGVKVEPGIEDAALSVVDIMGHELYEKQANTLRLAYEKLDKEGFSKMKIEETKTQQEIDVKQFEQSETENTSEGSQNVSETSSEAAVQADNTEEKVPEQMSEQTSEKLEEECGHLEKEPKQELEAKPEEEPEEDDDDKDDDHDEGEDSDEKKDLEEEGSHCEAQPAEEEPEVEHCEEKQSATPEDYSELKEKYDSLQKEYSALKDQYDSLVKVSDEKYAILSEKYDAYVKKEFIANAHSFINSIKLSSETREKFYKDCEDGKIATLEELKVQVALAALENAVVEEDPTINTPVITPDTTSVFEQKEKKTKKQGSWSTLKEYLGK